MFLPSDLRDQSSEGFFPCVHLDDPNSRHHLVHCADPVVSQNGRLTPAKKFSQLKSVVTKGITVQCVTKLNNP